MSTTIHPDDEMYTGNVDHYQRTGQQLAEVVKEASHLLQVENPTILELPCGYGRVTRQLVKHFPSHQITSCDIMKPAVQFCREQFGVHGSDVIEPVNEFRNIPDRSFDIAVMGSLITHLSEENSKKVVEHFLRKVKKGGYAILTTTGERAYEIMRSNSWFKVPENEQDVLRTNFEGGKFGFVNYWDGHTSEKKTVEYIGVDYGISLIPKAWVEELVQSLGAEIADYKPGGWDNHQDIIFVKV